MEQTLISVKEIIIKGWELYSKNYRLFIKPILVIFAFSLASSIIQYFEPDFIQNGYLIIPLLLLAVVVAFFYLGIIIFLTRIIDNLYKNQTMDLNQLLHESLRKVPSFFWVAFLTGLICFFGFILLIIPGIIFAVWYCFAGYVNILEDKNNKGLDALKSSKDLVKGRWFATLWRLIAPSLAIYIPLVILEMILVLILGAISIALNLDENQMVYLGIPLGIILNLVSLSLLPLFTSFQVILYNNLKAVKQTVPAEPAQPAAPVQPAQPAAPVPPAPIQ